MPNAGRGGSRKRKTTPNVIQRAGGSTPAGRPSSLPQQYDFTPAAATVQVSASIPPQGAGAGASSSAPHYRNYPPPQQLFQHSTNQPQRVDPLPPQETAQQDPPLSPDPETASHSHPSSQGNNFQEGIPAVLPELQEDSVVALNDILSVPGREAWCWTVQYYFNEIVKRRLKDMVSTARTTREQPPWIGETLWGTMCAYWDTEAAQKRSRTYSKARLSDRNGIGPHVHYSGPKSFQEIQDELEEKLGRPVHLGEVFIETHTKSDGSFVDQKSEKIAQAYQQNVRDRLSALEASASAVSDGSSRPPELTLDDYTAIFLEVRCFSIIISLRVQFNILSLMSFFSISCSPQKMIQEAILMD
ncbi:putative transposon protein [Arabidopsis thaliana]|uniref:Putative transposon protein n=1 Tax=Arabidopsis thaliana TaxID=3702 RepID=Q9ZPG8_ARATH|nr:contains similarity to Petunia PTTA' (GB:AF009516) [Arabidopsis thaliana]CAB80814.1 putative transposon protein [Arabidopsis thaliana]